MKVVINKNLVDVTPSDIKTLNPTFSLLHGRRFSGKTSDGSELKNVSLNNLILAVKNAAINSERPKQNANEVKDFIKVFEDLKNKGYETPDCQINKEGLLTRIATKIKHFFSKAQRNSLLKELGQLEKPRTPHEAVVDEKQQKKLTPNAQLQKYIENGEVNSIENFLKNMSNSKEFLNGKQYSDGSYDQLAFFLPLAINKNNFEMVSVLLKYKADPNARGRITVPIGHAVKVGNLEIIKLLLTNGANLTECNDILFKGKKENYLDIVECLIQHGVDINQGNDERSPLAFVAAKWDKDPDKVKSLLEIMIKKGAHFIPEDKVFYEGKIPQACLDFLKSRGVNF